MIKYQNLGDLRLSEQEGRPMGTIQRKLNAVREHWFQILIACLALALAFGLGG